MDNNILNNSGYYIINEGTKDSAEFKIHSENKNGFVIAEGILQEGNEVNRNRRCYPTEELAKAIMDPRQQELISTGNFKGEAGHPLDQSLTRQQKIDPEKEQVWYLKLWMDGDYVMGRFRGTNNALGESFNRDLKDGQRPSFSLRALGAIVNENGRMTIRNIRIVTYDRVYFPSHSKAYTTKIVTTESATSTGFKYYEIDPRSYFYTKSNEINALSESGNDIVGNSFVTKLTNSQLNNFLKESSNNVQTALKSFDTIEENMQLSSDGRTVNMQVRNGDRLGINLEDSVRKEIMNEIFKMF